METLKNAEERRAVAAIEEAKRNADGPRWTDKSPTEPGFYWFSGKADYMGAVDSVVEAGSMEPDEGLYITLPWCGACVEVADCRGKWAGPIERPPE